MSDLVLRFKRVRHPDVVCVERLEHFLREAQRDGLVVLLAGLRADFREMLGRLKFTAWYPADRFFPEDDEAWSATIRAVQYAYAQLGANNRCPHCADRTEAGHASSLYYLV